ncbi:PAS domain S-box protein [Ramlibacter sp. AW1]|uniref:histidine kinase n=1 Tax=Ramlibacter aurantiacus TaxID=2801330 RepID=A0A937D242_9BURK|nr:PAS domain S-box protein [Ramlibacter aurantiacus]MBL0421189.1 PAS domain S-box protein [Ramlibacter aurantiacus]
MPDSDPVELASAGPAGAAQPASPSPRWRALEGRAPTVFRVWSVLFDSRWLLWTLLLALVAVLLGTLVWLAGRYEASQVQGGLERDAAAAAGDIRSGLARNAQTLQALHSTSHNVTDWDSQAAQLLRDMREWLRLEWRDPGLRTIAVAETPYRAPVFERLGRAQIQPDLQLACAQARRLGGAAYSASYFLPQPDGMGMEVMDLCLPLVHAGEVTGYAVATYSLNELLVGMVGPQLSRSQQVSFNEPDGTRLALHGIAQRGSRTFSAQQLLDLPGTTILLRLDSWRIAPDLFPNVLTALVTAMSITLMVVLTMLVKDMRRRVQVEQDLADALAFRKAMEDSLVTGLRARDLEGRITYVNPAFCEMVGFTADELLGRPLPAPYWPPELAGEYQKRQEIRLAGQHTPPRDGFESVFMRKDGSRFPVLIIEAPLINAQGTQTGWMSAFLDISEQRRIEELSRASQERLQATARLATVGEMASLLSHELNQPLAAIASYATGSLNLLRNGDSDGLEGALQRIAQQAERAGKVIRSVHDFVRRRDQAREPVSPQALVEAVMPLVTLQARKLGVTVLTRLPAGLPQVTCDRTMVEQVLLNLARNAMQAMDAGRVLRPALTIQARRVRPGELGGKAWVEFAVVDIGPGISPQVRQQLFTPFFTTKAEGMGLGLSLCRTVIEQHGGALGFEPNLPQGTIFRFTLPASDTAPSMPAPAPITA